MQTHLSDTRLNSTPQRLLIALQNLRQGVYDEGNATVGRWKSEIRRREFLVSARNLAYYLALRQRDLRSLQAKLTP